MESADNTPLSHNIEEEKIENNNENNNNSQGEGEGEEANLPPPEIPQPQDDREYGCKYCQKKFSNKQALGGHQNAHKVERALEKSARDLQENPFGYFAAGYGEASSYPGLNSNHSFLSSFNRSQDFINRSILNWPYPPQQHGIHIGYNVNNPRPNLPAMATHQTYVPPPPPLPGYNSVYPGWNPRVTLIQPSYMHNHHHQIVSNSTIPFTALEGGSSSSVPVRPVSRLTTNFVEQIRPERFYYHGGENRNLQINDNAAGDQEVDDSEIDLSLKL